MLTLTLMLTLILTLNTSINPNLHQQIYWTQNRLRTAENLNRGDILVAGYSEVCASGWFV